jgi:hypothetical protein
MAVPALPNLSSAQALLQAAEYGSVQRETLEQAFLEPPDAAWPWVYWFVSDGNITREGVTADLEAMHRVGIRGVLYMECDLFTPKGPARFLSPQWRELIQHAVKEATRLGITMNMNNDGGYTGSGGPWITPDLSMQVMVLSETALEGPKRFTGTLPQPKTVEDYYQDIAVLAFPTPPAESVRMAERSPKLTYGLERKSFDATKLIDGNLATVALLPPPEADQPLYLNIDFPEPFTAQALTIALDPWNAEITGTLEASDDGQHFQTVGRFKMRWPVSSVNFPKVTARYFRIAMKGPPIEADWLFQTFGKGFPLSEVELHSGLRIEDIPGKAAYVRQEVFSGEPALTPEMVVRRDQILDLSNKLDSEGRLTWEVPAGKWTVLRIGHTSTGKMNHPAPKESLGLECDKLSKKAVEAHFAGLIGKLLEDQAAANGKALKMTHVDSWEVGAQNWTPGFREEFQKRRGYDLLPYLAVLTGRAVESREISERFLWDLRRTVCDLLLENYAAHLREISHQHGLTLSIEAYGSGPFDDVAYGGRADVPMCEFWSGVPTWWDFLMGWCKAMASAGHVYGKPIIAAESFTAEPDSSKWQSHPFRMKPLGDLAFTLGVNRHVLDLYTMQPWLDRKPGMTLGPFGIHYERTNTWWEQSRAWNTYLARCQSMLQSGQFVADVAYLGSENSPNSFPKRESLDPVIPPGYDFDDLPPEVLLKQMTVRDGQLVLPSGMSYRILVLPPGRTITPALLGKIKELVVAGARVVGPRPASSPSLADYPRCDAEVRQLAAELWGDCDGVSITENRYGKGKVVWGKPLADVLAGMDARPDFACFGVTPGEEIRYIHHEIDGDDLYFVASALPEARRFLCTFRVAGKRPELWWPDTGRIEPVAVYDERADSTMIPLALDSCGSVFVVFRSSATSLTDRVISLRRNGVELSGLAPTPAPETQLGHEAVGVEHRGATEYHIKVAQPGTYELKTAAGRTLKAEVPALPNPIEIGGPWELGFPKGWGAPEHVTLERLISWTDHPNPGVKYFSGTATYRRQFEVPREMLARNLSLYLDLGRVSVIAQAKLNGRDLGILWKPPFRADITDFLHAGANELLVSVVNLWPNRLIGDEQLPDDCEWIPPSTPGNPTPPNYGAALARWPQWFLAQKPSPTGRLTFTTWKFWTKDDPLMESGLLGPVFIGAEAIIVVHEAQGH